MSFNVFPPVFKRNLDERVKDDIDREKRRTDVTQKTINSNKSEKPAATGFFVAGAVIGFGVDMFMCIAKDNGNTWWTILGLILGGIMYGIVLAVHNESISNADEKLSREINLSQRTICQIVETAEDEYKKYCSEFEESAQIMSVDFAESQLAIEVIDWITNGFIKTNDAADRRTHIQEIHIPFVFNVHKNKITCNLGTYDFELKRCRNLNSPLEQTALSRAIAAAIQLNITIKYPQDSSGTNVVINTTYTYNDDHVSASVIYTAPNGNYRAVRDWK